MADDLDRFRGYKGGSPADKIVRRVRDASRQRPDTLRQIFPILGAREIRSRTATIARNAERFENRTRRSFAARSSLIQNPSETFEAWSCRDILS